ncbi:MAG TPA: helix-turn-helix domain-containing protein [Solirubrobacteraceae bacterium]|jgi:AcrR family transcriptional regulator|nr:helix-turn-helix domain-containing protein [Solirubrobacteraceae bacterium]
MPRGEFDREERKAQTRARLLEAAAAVYARRGFDGATLDEVAAEAGFTKGAVYSHFGSKENLLLALSHQQRIAQLTEQLELFDRERTSWERPLAGSARWMEVLREEPDRFRLFVELWVRAQRDERLRERLAAGVEDLREMLAGFARDSAADAGTEPDAEADRQLANVFVALTMGMGIVSLLDERALPPELLGNALSVLIRALESDPQARATLTAPLASAG